MVLLFSDFSELASRNLNHESPLSGDKSDPHIYYIFRYPMTCGTLCFTGNGCGVCKLDFVLDYEVDLGQDEAKK